MNLIQYNNYNDLLAEASVLALNSLALEEQHYNTNHAVLGYYVATSWNLPSEICQIILRHHEVDYLDEITDSTEQLAFAILKAAENLIEQTRRQSVTPDWESVREAVFDVLGISDMDYSDLEDGYTLLY